MSMANRTKNRPPSPAADAPGQIPLWVPKTTRHTAKRVVAAAVLLGLAALGGRAADEPGAFSVLAAGAKADGSADCTAAFPKALDEAGQAGGRVLLPAGRYLVKGSLRIPADVTLQGVMESPVWSEPLKDSVILATGGRGQRPVQRHRRRRSPLTAK